MADAVDTFLREVRFNEWGVPDRKLPDCPSCQEDEIYFVGREARCYVCNFKRKLALEAAHA